MKDAMKTKMLIFGGLTLVPGLRDVLLRRLYGTGGTDSARYCYSVWLRHLVMARARGMTKIGPVVAELGPGDSIGIGLAALMSGAERYFAFDVVQYTSLERNLQVFDELVELFKAREDVPNDDEFPLVIPKLDDYRFPAEILTDELLDAALDEARLARIRASLIDTAAPTSMISYFAPWNDIDVVEESSVDLIYSQAVLEHVDDLAETYRTCNRWLKDGGMMSHSIDFRCHGVSERWNGHWAYSDFEWRMIRGKRPWLINREPYSAHLRLFEDSGFQVAFQQPVRSSTEVQAGQLAARFRALSQDDLTTSCAFVQATKPASESTRT